MSTCVNCGHELGVGRFCTNCGHPVGPPATDWRTDTAERQPAVPPVPPPPPPASPPPTPAAGSVPPKPRFPLFADEVDGHVPGPVAAPPPPPPPPAGSPSHHRRRRPWGPWVGVFLVMVIVAVLGIWLLTDDDGDPTATDNGRDGKPSHSASHSPSKSPSQSPSSEPPAPGDVTADSTVAVPATAPGGQDVQGNRVDYVADNMLDGVAETCWRMAGDATGKEITITLPGETTVRSVGLVNGYAKTARDAQGRELDWYHGNRRVLSVEWVFDDGTTLSQDLDDSPSMQSIDVDDVSTSTITLRLVSVSGPGTGRASRDYTAISDLSVISAR
jgi:hypothetical protein